MTRKHLLTFLTACVSDTGISAVSYMIAPKISLEVVATPLV